MTFWDRTMVTGVQIMRLVEDRMLARSSRRLAYRKYQQRVPMCIPVPIWLKECKLP